MVYLDYAATTPMKFAPVEKSELKNSHSPHAVGINSYKAIEQAREDIKRAVGFKSGIVLFGGNATSLIASVMSKIKNKNGFIYCNPYEHEAIYDWADMREMYLTYENNLIEIDENDIVCHMLMNNITGTTFDLKKISKKNKFKKAFLFADCTAAIGHMEFPKDFESICDAWVCSAHKFYGPQNSGILWLSDRFASQFNIKSEKDLSIGTLPVFNILATRDAFVKYQNSKYIQESQERFKNYWLILSELLDSYSIKHKRISSIECPEYNWIKWADNYAINAICFENINADALATYLSSKEIYIGVGHSACAEDSDYRVLGAFGLTEQEAQNTIRVSFGEDTTENDIVELANEIYNYKQKFLL